MRPADLLARARSDLDYATAEIPGRVTAKGRKSEPRVAVAVAHLEAWTPTASPGTSGDSTRGGTSSPTEDEERVEDRIVARRAETGRLRIMELSKRIATDLAELQRLCVWATETIDPRKLPPDVTPGCQNPRCDHLLEDGLRTGECARCRKWRSRNNGEAFPDRHADLRRAAS